MKLSTIFNGGNIMVRNTGQIFSHSI